MGIPAAGLEINDFSLERHGARVFIGTDIDRKMIDYALL